MMTLTVRHKRAYGVDRFYPVCARSAHLLELAQRETFTQGQLDGLVRVLGYEITVQNESGVGLYVLEQTAEERWVSHG